MLSMDSSLTYDEFVLLPADGQQHELIDGGHVVSPSPNATHQRVSRAMFRALDGFVTQRGLGEVFFAPLDVVLSLYDVVVPDIIFVPASQADRVTDRHVRGAPSLVVEVVSATTRDRDEHQKRLLYERAGVMEYWVVDPERRVILVHRGHTAGRFTVTRLGAGDTLTTPVLPGFSAGVRAIVEP